MKLSYLETNVKLYNVAQIREIELNYAKINDQGTYPLMEAAGKDIYIQIKKRWPDAKKILILAGKGNNGGDGFVIARLAALDNKQVTLCKFFADEQTAFTSENKADHILAFEKLTGSGISYIDHMNFTSTALDEFDLIIDAMLGTGIKGPVRQPFKDVIENINKITKDDVRKTAILAVDVPSGLNADTGSCEDEAIKADVTLTLVGYKRGLYTAHAANYCGKLKLLDLEIPETCFNTLDCNVSAQDWYSLRHLLKPRKANSHKGDFGHCLVIGGATGMAGAAILASSATARCGSGLTSARLETEAANLLSICPEVMAKNVSLGKIESEINQMVNANCLVVGPGLGKGDWATQWMSLLTANQKIASMKKIWDADALNWLAENPTIDNNRILTPHPGEAGRLLAVSTQAINQDRYSACEKIAQKYGGVCVLKGAGTIIAHSNGEQFVCPVGNPGMASGGMGDVLSGIIGGLLAQGFDLMSAASLGVSIHGESADRVAGPAHYFRGMLASDLFQFFPELLNPVLDKN